MDIKIETESNLDTKMCVYKLVFPNNKIYVGQTTRTLKHRLNGHIQCLKRNLKTPIYNAINKYKTFKVFILEIANSIEELNMLESYYITKLNSIVDNKFGYNSDFGGNNKLPSKAMIDKCRKAKIGKKHTQETKDKMSKSSKGLKKKSMSEEGELNISLSKIGKKHSEETKLKMKEKHIKRWKERILKLKS